MVWKNKARPEICTSSKDTSQSLGETSDWTTSKVPPFCSMPKIPNPNSTSDTNVPDSLARRICLASMSSIPSIWWNTLDSLLGGRYFGLGLNFSRTELPSRPSPVNRNASGNIVSNSADLRLSASISPLFFRLRWGSLTSDSICSRALIISFTVGGLPLTETGHDTQHSGVWITLSTSVRPGFSLLSKYIQYRGSFCDAS